MYIRLEISDTVILPSTKNHMKFFSKITTQNILADLWETYVEANNIQIANRIAELQTHQKLMTKVQNHIVNPHMGIIAKIIYAIIIGKIPLETVRNLTASMWKNWVTLLDISFYLDR